MNRLPTASRLALLGAAVASVPAAAAAVTTGDGGAALGGTLAMVGPYLAVAAALARRTVWAGALGVGVAGLMTWLTSFALTETAGDLWRGSSVRPTALPFLLMTAVGVAVLSAGLRDLVLAIHATGFWTRTPAAARLAVIAVCYWALVFVADTYLTANPPLGRMLLAPTLVVVELAAALMLRSSRPRAQAGGVLLAAVAGLATAAYWIGYAPYLTLRGGPPAEPTLAYFTLLPWPVLLALSLALDALIVGTGTRRLASR